MTRKSKLSFEEKLKAIAEYKSGQGTLTSIGTKYGIHCETLRRIILKYDSGFMSELQTKHINKKYPIELQIQSVADYLSRKGSQSDICIKYNISSISILQKWIKCYNGHKEFKEPGSRTEKYMTKGRKTTQEERVEIVSFCIEHGKDYGVTIEKYGVSYQQIYLWVKKYEERGIDGLTDRRGRTKPKSEMTEAEKLRYENRLLQAKLKEKEMELALLKKLEELERGGC